MSRRDSARPRAERAEGRPAAEAAPEPGLWRHGDFRRYWGGQAVTVAGFGITTIGISVIAVVDLHASTMHVALIAVAGKLPALLLSLHAGVLADRYRKRPIIITCDVLCALTLSSIPLAQFVGQVTLGQLYAVAFLVSAFQVVGSNASISYLPTLLREKQLKEETPSSVRRTRWPTSPGTTSAGCWSPCWAPHGRSPWTLSRIWSAPSVC